jgi:hypothetical protein
MSFCYEMERMNSSIHYNRQTFSIFLQEFQPTYCIEMAFAVNPLMLMLFSATPLDNNSAAESLSPSASPIYRVKVLLKQQDDDYYFEFDMTEEFDLDEKKKCTMGNTGTIDINNKHNNTFVREPVIAFHKVTKVAAHIAHSSMHYISAHWLLQHSFNCYHVCCYLF